MDHEPWAADLAASSAMEMDAAGPGQQPLRAPPLPTPLQPPAPRRSGREVKSTGVWIDGFYVKKSNMYDLEGGERSVWDQELGGERTWEGAAAAPAPPRAAAPAAAPRAPRRAREPTPQEKRRAAHAASLREAKAGAVGRRARFLLEHEALFRPFNGSVGWCAAVAAPGPRAVVPAFERTPAYVRADMRAYQLEGLRFLAQTYEDGVSAILADEMGLGKTLQTLSFISYLLRERKVSGPFLVICPLSVLSSWLVEASKFCPELRAVKLHSADAAERDRLKATLKDVDSYDLVVTTFEMAKSQSMQSVLGGQMWWRYVILDEGHIIKNEASDISKAVRRFHFEHALLLTGTPLQNDLHELWALLNFLFPDVFPESAAFDAAFDRGGGAAGDGSQLRRANEMMAVLMKRRVKQEVEQRLPPKIETKILCPLAPCQRWWYKRLLLRQSQLLAELESDAKDAGAGAASGGWKKLQSLLMQLRKCCNHPYLFEGADPDPGITDDALVEASGKLHVLDRLLTKLKAKGHRCVLFSQFTSTLDLLDDVLRYRGYEFSRLDGSTNRVQRTVDIQAFNAPGSGVFLFLMSTRAGGLGVNLQTADTCILFDSDWNPQADAQAMARVHRIGQTKPVHVYRLVTKGTVEERIVQRAEKKLYLDSMVNRDGARVAAAQDGAAAADAADGDAPTGSELLASLTFGAHAIVNGTDADRPLSDAELDAIIDRTRTADTSLGDVLSGGAAHSAEGFESQAQAVSLHSLEGEDFSEKAAATATLGDLGREFAEVQKRARKKRTTTQHVVGVGNVEVLTSEYGDGAGGFSAAKAEEPKAKDVGAVRWEAAASRAALEAIGGRQIAGRDYDHECECLACGDGGDIVMCDQCPTSWHVPCLAALNAKMPTKMQWGCPHHSCLTCGRKAAAAGGLLFRCMRCPRTFCEDHLVPTATIVGKCQRFIKLGQNHPKQACFILCSKDCLDFAVARGEVPASVGYGTAGSIHAAAGLDTTAAAKTSKRCLPAHDEPEAKKPKLEPPPAMRLDERKDWDRLDAETQDRLNVVLLKKRWTVGGASPHFVLRASRVRTGAATALDALHAALFVDDAPRDAARPWSPADVAADIAARWNGPTVKSNASKGVKREKAAAIYLRLVRTFEAWKQYEVDALLYAVQVVKLVKPSKALPTRAEDILNTIGGKAKRHALAHFFTWPRQNSLWLVSLTPPAVRAEKPPPAPPAPPRKEGLRAAKPAAKKPPPKQKARPPPAKVVGGFDDGGFSTLDLAPNAILEHYPLLAPFVEVVERGTPAAAGPKRGRRGGGDDDVAPDTIVPRVPDPPPRSKAKAKDEKKPAAKKKKKKAPKTSAAAEWARGNGLL